MLSSINTEIAAVTLATRAGKCDNAIRWRACSEKVCPVTRVKGSYTHHVLFSNGIKRPLAARLLYVRRGI